IRWGLGAAMGLLLLVVVSRLLVRRIWLADLLAALVAGAVISMTPLETLADASGVLVGGAVAYAIFGVLRRFGVLPFSLVWILNFPVFLPVIPGSWYAGRALTYHLVPLAVAAWAAWSIFRSSQVTHHNALAVPEF